METASTKPRRSYQIDAVLVIAATALGLLMTKECLRGYDMMLWFDGGRHALKGFRRWGFASVSLFVCWTLVLPLAILLSPQRPRLRRLARLPGLVPGGVVALMSVAVIPNIIAYRYKTSMAFSTRGLVGLFAVFPSHVVDIGRSVGFAVAATWLVLGLGGWWRSEAHWADRAGRLLGVYWIAMFGARVYYDMAS